MAQQHTKGTYKPTAKTEQKLKSLVRSANIRTAKSKAPEYAKLGKVNYKELISKAASYKDMQRIIKLLENYTDKNAMTIDDITGLAKWQKKELQKLKAQETRNRKKREEQAQKESVFVPGIGEVNYLGKATKKHIPKINLKNIPPERASKRIMTAIERQSQRYYHDKNEQLKENFIKAVKQNFPEIASEIEQKLNNMTGTTFYERIYKEYTTELDFSFMYSASDVKKKENEILSVIEKASTDIQEK